MIAHGKRMHITIREVIIKVGKWKSGHQEKEIEHFE
jgi:hypothetical protein